MRTGGSDTDLEKFEEALSLPHSRLALPLLFARSLSRNVAVGSVQRTHRHVPRPSEADERHANCR